VGSALLVRPGATLEQAPDLAKLGGAAEVLGGGSDELEQFPSGFASRSGRSRRRSANSASQNGCVPAEAISEALGREACSMRVSG
jgi:hypothetical protein